MLFALAKYQFWNCDSNLQITLQVVDRGTEGQSALSHMNISPIDLAQGAKFLTYLMMRVIKHLVDDEPYSIFIPDFAHFLVRVQYVETLSALLIIHIVRKLVRISLQRNQLGTSKRENLLLNNFIRLGGMELNLLYSFRVALSSRVE